MPIVNWFVGDGIQNVGGTITGSGRITVNGRAIRTATSPAEDTVIEEEPIQPLIPVANLSRLWPTDETPIIIQFLDGKEHSWFKKAVIDLLDFTYNSANRLLFQYYNPRVNSSSHIRVKFITEGESWSIIGHDPQHGENSPTMELNLSPEIASGSNILLPKDSATILHQFGHAIGLIHRHKHPGCAVGCEENPEHTSANQIAFTAHADPKSVMNLPPSRGGTSISQQNTELSARDEKMIYSLYPDNGRDPGGDVTIINGQMTATPNGNVFVNTGTLTITGEVRIE
ncbi:hypothetical protein ONZ43_g4110 [Nemania bipapillata]|uniref:Uncharacterized protein n=1 Tax=Nemania bipapillata TaxID=110536 RepID=A0ACC2IRW3_9PEZI|nr:hypothetical protein ONZ43_g4110 [Nemania bipapillata]